jgi:tRNA G18 (ribose-2'-O)-methylase SpoU
MNRIEVTDLTLPELSIYASSSETQLLHYYEPDLGIFIAESLRVIGRALDAGYEPMSLLVEPGVLEETEGNVFSRIGDAPVYVAEPGVLSQLAGYKLTGGALCAMRRKELPAVETVCSEKKRIAVLEGVTNPTNVGAIFRSAAALGVEAILMTQDCSDPLYRRAARVSMGTVFQIPWGFSPKKRITNLVEDPKRKPEEYAVNVELLKALGYTTVAMALTDRSVSIADEHLQQAEKLAILLGNENFGLTEATIAGCDYTAKIPMQHGVDSLNVAAASAVAFWELCGRR